MTKINNIARIENDFIFNACYKLTAKEQKIILFLIANINPTKQIKFERQTIPIKKLRWAIMGQAKNGSFYNEIKNLTFRLVKKGIVFDTNVLIEGRMMPGYINWFQAITPIINEEGLVCLEFLFSQKLKPFLLELKQYVQIDTNQLLMLHSGFSVHLFQIFQAKKSLMAKHQRSTKINFPLADLKNTLGITDKYKDWRNFKRRVIEAAINEINLHTNINVDFKVIKKNGQVFSLEFEVKNKKDASPTPSKTKSKSKSAKKITIEQLSFAQLKAFHILTKYGIKVPLALSMVASVQGSEIIGFQDWYFEEVIRIFETKTHQKTATAKTGTFVNWFLKKRIFEQGDHFAVIMERLQERKKILLKQEKKAWDNRMLAKGITAERFREMLGRRGK